MRGTEYIEKVYEYFNSPEAKEFQKFAFNLADGVIEKPNIELVASTSGEGFVHDNDILLVKGSTELANTLPQNTQQPKV